MTTIEKSRQCQGKEDDISKQVKISKADYRFINKRKAVRKKLSKIMIPQQFIYTKNSKHSKERVSNATNKKKKRKRKYVQEGSGQKKYDELTQKPIRVFKM